MTRLDSFARMGNEALAFGLVCGSGAATFVGALGVYLNRGKLDPAFLSASMGASAGVMIYVSFVEIFCAKAVDSFAESGSSDVEARRHATLLFFAGIVSTFALDKLAHLLMRRQGWSAEGGRATRRKNDLAPERRDDEQRSDAESLEVRDASGGKIEATEMGKVGGHDEGLRKAGIITALAIGLHNFPEGLATYMATIGSSSTGIAVAVAIALHNIPEGLAVAVPVFYSSGSRAKGILWGVLSGLSEPLGGLFGHLVLKGTDMNPLAYGTLFALVGGMMTYISFAELLPNALYHDPSGHSATASCLLGMAVMAASLLLFEA